MPSHIASDLHQAYFEEVFTPQLGKPGALKPERPTSSVDLDDKTDSFEKKVRQFIYDVRHLMRKNNIPAERAFQIRSSKTNYGAEVIKTAKEKLGIKGGGTTPVSEEQERGKKLFSIVINYKNGTTYRKRTTREEITRLRSNPNVSSVEMTRYGIDGLAKKDYDGDGNRESSSKEHAGAVHNAIQRKTGGIPDGQDTRGKSSKKKLKSYGVSEGFSNWRQDLKEIINIDDEISSRDKNQIKEKNVDNYAGGKDSVIKINPEVTEKAQILGGTIVESVELTEDYLNETINVATEFFYNSGLNENGVDIVIEELGEEKFVEFVFDLAEHYFLNEERSAKKRRGGKSYDEIKAEIDAREATKAKTGKKITASKTKEATEKAKKIQAPSPQKTAEGKKTGIAGRVGAALGAVVRKGQEDIRRVQDAAQTARDVATRRGAEAKAVYDAVRERGRKAEQSAQATRARRKATVVAGKAAQEAGRTAIKMAGAAGSAVGAGVVAKRRGASPAGVAGAALGAGVRKLTREEIELQEKSESEQQQKLFGLALSVKRGETPRSEVSDEVLKIVDSMSEKKIRDFAKTPHSEVPKKKVTEALSNPKGSGEEKTPLITRIQKSTIRTQIQNKQNNLGEDIDSFETSNPQISRLNSRIAQLKLQLSKKNDPNIKGKALSLVAQKERLEAQSARQQLKNKDVDDNKSNTNLKLNNSK